MVTQGCNCTLIKHLRHTLHTTRDRQLNREIKILLIQMGELE